MRRRCLRLRSKRTGPQTPPQRRSADVRSRMQTTDDPVSFLAGGAGPPRVSRNQDPRSFMRSAHAAPCARITPAWRTFAGSGVTDFSSTGRALSLLANDPAKVLAANPSGATMAGTVMCAQDLESSVMPRPARGPANAVGNRMRTPNLTPPSAPPRSKERHSCFRRREDDTGSYDGEHARQR
jgi:hypothetical protein